MKFSADDKNCAVVTGSGCINNEDTSPLEEDVLEDLERGT